MRKTRTPGWGPSGKQGKAAPRLQAELLSPRPQGTGVLHNRMLRLALAGLGMERERERRQGNSAAGAALAKQSSEGLRAGSAALPSHPAAGVNLPVPAGQTLSAQPLFSAGRGGMGRVWSPPGQGKGGTHSSTPRCEQEASCKSRDPCHNRFLQMGSFRGPAGRKNCLCSP